MGRKLPALYKAMIDKSRHETYCLSQRIGIGLNVNQRIEEK
jgi:hypothetical protein